MKNITRKLKGLLLGLIMHCKGFINHNPMSILYMNFIYEEITRCAHTSAQKPCSNNESPLYKTKENYQGDEDLELTTK